jgi:hypothetical protein
MDGLTSIRSNARMFRDEIAAKSLDVVPQRLVGRDAVQARGPAGDRCA